MTDLMPRTANLLSSGVDWITASARDGQNAEELFERAARLSREEITMGNQKRPWSMAGFHGYICGGCQFGTRNKEVLVRLSGHCAAFNWRMIKEVSDNVSRFDLQCTFQFDGPVGPTIRRHFEQAKRFSEGRSKPATISVLSTNNGPSTIYFNKRVSDQFGRIYDKGAESKLPCFRDAVRYEIELKGKAAMRASDSMFPLGRDDLFAGRLVADFFDRRGVTLGKS